ncbi:MAG: NAD(P)H-hydrate dehydratase [Candidatus Brockarchaeota archaeon]|nr:NAD(P)H-hydrate dehydratase [Candidatus Brockarchaeota archaeon]MBO3762866.1 NAD(P)H-hydrate dehydratase [Candidatus Brockarchaeota archaeon]MBO3768777.1 NAD(P)H-hydrate dehydratase [Candidatus Brockarchaeota archaeon]MBO3802215.1 NAD(P)H-hydrate dehydratase [Candidatus Brockarchaeota archaeon]
MDTRIISSVDEMRITEENAEALGISRLQLMENAGSSVASFVKGVLNKFPAKVVVVCGPGNNGGDGLVAASYLHSSGHEVKVFLLSKQQELKTNEVRTNFNRFLEEGGKIVSLDDDEFLTKLRSSLEGADLVIDAIFGTGVKGDIGGIIANSILYINESKRYVVSVDTPSGLDPFTSATSNVYVKANVTLTFHALKKGLLNKKEITGNVNVVDIGIPEEANLIVNEKEVSLYIPPRKRFSHKGNYGKVLIVGGSKLYSGAPMLAGTATIRAGAGLVYVAAPEKVAYSIKAQAPDLIVLPLQGENLSKENLNELSEVYEKADVLVVGNGLGYKDETLEAVSSLVADAQNKGKKVIVDADGLRAFELFKEEIKEGSLLITPHAGEFFKISGIKVGDTWKEKYIEVKNFSLHKRCTTLLKGYHTVVSNGKIVKVLVGGNPGLSKGGSGDVLVGLIAGFAAQGLDLVKASIVGGFTLNLAADALFQKYGFHYLASELLEESAKVLAKYDKITE